MVELIESSIMPDGQIETFIRVGDTWVTIPGKLEVRFREKMRQAEVKHGEEETTTDL